MGQQVQPTKKPDLRAKFSDFYEETFLGSLRRGVALTGSAELAEVALLGAYEDVFRDFPDNFQRAKEALDRQLTFRSRELLEATRRSGAKAETLEVAMEVASRRLGMRVAFTEVEELLSEGADLLAGPLPLPDAATVVGADEADLEENQTTTAAAKVVDLMEALEASIQAARRAVAVTAPTGVERTPLLVDATLLSNMLGEYEARKDPQSKYSAIVAKASDLFGGSVGALGWLASPNPALGGQTPSVTAATAEGQERVLRLLGQLEHGVYS